MFRFLVVESDLECSNNECKHSYFNSFSNLIFKMIYTHYLQRQQIKMRYIRSPHMLSITSQCLERHVDGLVIIIQICIPLPHQNQIRASELNTPHSCLCNKRSVMKTDGNLYLHWHRVFFTFNPHTPRGLVGKATDSAVCFP